MTFEGLYCIFLFCQIVLRECIGSLSACLFTACLYTENGMVSSTVRKEHSAASEPEQVAEMRR